MAAEVIEILTFGRFAPRGTRVRRWVEPGRPLSVSREDVLVPYVDQVGGREVVMLEVLGPSAAAGPRPTALSLNCAALNMDVVARAVARRPDGWVRAVMVEIINRSLAARAS